MSLDQQEIIINNELLEEDLVTAYIKPIQTERGTAYAIHDGENGSQLAIYTSQEAAFFAAFQNDLKPEYVH